MKSLSILVAKHCLKLFSWFFFLKYITKLNLIEYVHFNVSKGLSKISFMGPVLGFIFVGSSFVEIKRTVRLF